MDVFVSINVIQRTKEDLSLRRPQPLERKAAMRQPDVFDRYILNFMARVAMDAFGGDALHSPQVVGAEVLGFRLGRRRVAGGANPGAMRMLGQ